MKLRKNIILKLDTNGFILTKQRAKKILDSKIDYLSISLDTLEEDLYDQVRNQGKFSTVMDNLKYLLDYKKEHNCPTHVEVTLLNSKLNIEGLPETIMRISRLGLDEVNCGVAQRLFETDKDIFILDEKDPGKIKHYRSIFRKAQQVCAKCSMINTQRSIDYILEMLDNGKNQGFRQQEKLCYCGIYSPFIFSDGTMLPCCFAVMATLSNKSYMKAMNMGNVLKDGFERVWREEKARQVRRLALEKRNSFAFCQHCLYDESGLFTVLNKISSFVYRV